MKVIFRRDWTADQIRKILLESMQPAKRVDEWLKYDCEFTLLNSDEITPMMMIDTMLPNTDVVSEVVERECHGFESILVKLEDLRCSYVKILPAPPGGSPFDTILMPTIVLEEKEEEDE